MNPEEEIKELLMVMGCTLATAESCTGGGVAALITSVSGSSSYFKGGVVAYANEVKENLLHVRPSTLQQYGAVSKETVIEMVCGIINLLHVDYAIATSGITGPGGGTKQKPVGTIWIAVGSKDGIVTLKEEGDYGRNENVQRTIQNALLMLIEQLKQRKSVL